MINRVGSLLPIIVPLLAVMGPGSHSGESHNVIRSRFPQPPPDSDRSDVFISYCEKDQAYLERIEIHLKPIRDKGVQIYRYDMVEPGAVVKDEAQSALFTSVVAVLLISADYLASDLMQHELPDLLERAEVGGTRVLRLDVGTCDLSDWERLTRYQRVAGNAPPLNRLRGSRQDVIYVELLKAIKKRLIECGRYAKSSTADTPEGT